ncbi:hypothetical protein BP5796_05704 [Coleophoma crateriformis]|uniref:Glycoside hydrolase family 12 protein n=1 Tax=Coleophoma crateriformis TaxID=565419 RepID=A0A3D8RUV5_9HELO|nr:hypothetical protein BP5796_05704 [Coleophoma crateriformis]
MGMDPSKITTFDNETYATSTTAPEFSVTWQYPPGSTAAPVHAFPNAQVNSSDIPIKLQSLKEINLDLHWTYGIGTKDVASTNMQTLTNNSVETNVAIDMFLDSDKTKSQSSSDAQYEVMVWLATIGSSAQPIGLENGAVSTQVVNNSTFNLYTGENSLNQTVLTWVAANATEIFSGDIAPLLTKLSAMNTTFPTSSTYLGYLSFGSEAFSSNVNVTFSVPKLSIDVQS